MTRPCFPCLCLPQMPKSRFINAPQNTHTTSRPVPQTPGAQPPSLLSGCQPPQNLCAQQKSGEPEVTKSPGTMAISVTRSPDGKLPPEGTLQGPSSLLQARSYPEPQLLTQVLNTLSQGQGLLVIPLPPAGGLTTQTPGAGQPVCSSLTPRGG